jgi:hypothetical protein
VLALHSLTVSPHAIRPLFVSRRKRTSKYGVWAAQFLVQCPHKKYGLRYLQLTVLTNRVFRYVLCLKRESCTPYIQGLSGVGLSCLSSHCFTENFGHDLVRVSAKNKPLFLYHPSPHWLSPAFSSDSAEKCQAEEWLVPIPSVKQHFAGVDIFTSSPSLLLNAASESW